ncbi:hypothetical protein CDD83_6273 [Cordyceps sp. RAO-2017]|nr:hypothetical protein CDD83_6273 [Cordyceps sp. RAO-2017]
MYGAESRPLSRGFDPDPWALALFLTTIAESEQLSLASAARLLLRFSGRWSHEPVDSSFDAHPLPKLRVPGTWEETDLTGRTPPSRTADRSLDAREAVGSDHHPISRDSAGGLTSPNTVKSTSSKGDIASGQRRSETRARTFTFQSSQENTSSCPRQPASKREWSSWSCWNVRQRARTGDSSDRLADAEKNEVKEETPKQAQRPEEARG